MGPGMRPGGARLGALSAPWSRPGPSWSRHRPGSPLRAGPRRLGRWAGPVAALPAPGGLFSAPGLGAGPVGPVPAGAAAPGAGWRCGWAPARPLRGRFGSAGEPARPPRPPRPGAAGASPASWPGSAAAGRSDPRGGSSAVPGLLPRGIAGAAAAGMASRAPKAAPAAPVSDGGTSGAQHLPGERRPGPLAAPRAVSGHLPASSPPSAGFRRIFGRCQTGEAGLSFGKLPGNRLGAPLAKALWTGGDSGLAPGGSAGRKPGSPNQRCAPGRCRHPGMCSRRAGSAACLVFAFLAVVSQRHPG